MQNLVNSNFSQTHDSSLSWQEIYRTSLRNQKQLEDFLGVELTKTPYSILIPKPFAEKIKQAGIYSPLGLQFLPQTPENDQQGFDDPIGDKVNYKNPGIIHRYKKRILFTPTVNCPIHCRYCFRKNELNPGEDFLKGSIKSLTNYLLDHPDVEEVILTGGDPLILSDEKLLEIAEVISISSVKYFRIHTRTPIILPERVNDRFIKTLKTITELFEQVIFVVHTNHKDELYPEVQAALKKISNLPIRCLTQTVLLKNINSDSDTLINLFQSIVKIKFSPYYLHHPDLVKGAMHFYLDLEEGRKIYSKLRNQLPGWAIPHYIIDHPDGHGKQLAFNPETYGFSGNLLNLQGEQVEYNPN